ncbi:hypothetical protein BsWGS_03272 [Bradybaena similaris]
MSVSGEEYLNNTTPAPEGSVDSRS